jgi:hypothetical protein
MDTNSVASSIAYTRIVSVSFLLSHPNARYSSTIEWEVRQWFVAFSLRKSNALTNGTLAGSIAILVRKNFWGMQGTALMLAYRILTLGL